MLRTEGNAGGRWCPFSRVVQAKTSVNREAGRGLPQGTFCIGSDCMAWRVTRAGMVFEVGEQGAIFRQQKVDDPIYGYCGLAGKVDP